jgi:hypothetical protein
MHMCLMHQVSGELNKAWNEACEVSDWHDRQRGVVKRTFPNYYLRDRSFVMCRRVGKAQVRGKGERGTRRKRSYDNSVKVEVK